MGTIKKQYCSSCGLMIKPSHRFCIQCGISLSENQNVNKIDDSINKAKNVIENVSNELSESIYIKEAKQELNRKKYPQNIGILLVILGITIILLTLKFETDRVKFHILNDLSMCPCGADISSMDPTFQLVMSAFLILLGIFTYLRNL